MSIADCARPEPAAGPEAVHRTCTLRWACAGLETLDTLIMAGIADTRADAIGWALARTRERPAYERLREQVREIDRLRRDF